MIKSRICLIFRLNRDGRECSIILNFFFFFFQDTSEKIDFTKLCTANLDFLTTQPLISSNVYLRRDLYITWANSDDIHTMFRIIMNQMTSFSGEYCIEFDGKEIASKEILYSLLECKKSEQVPEIFSVPSEIKTVRYPLCVQIPLSATASHTIFRRTCYSSDLKKIGRPHMYMHHTKDSSSSADEDSREPQRKKPCQVPYNIDYGGQLSAHLLNKTDLKEPIAKVDILILCHYRAQKLSQDVARYLGLISIEDMMDAVEKECGSRIITKQNLIKDLLADPNAKSYRPLHQMIMKQLMFGYNNVCLTCDLTLFSHIYANVKAVIVDKSYDVSPLADARENSNFIVIVENNVFDYIGAISQIVESSLNYESHLTMNVIVSNYGEDSNKKELRRVKFPLISVIPLYILRTLCQKFQCHPKNKIDLSSLV